MAAFPLPCRRRRRRPSPLALRHRQPLILLRRRSGLPEPPRPAALWRRRGLQETSCRYGTAAAMAAMPYSLFLARRCPASCQCSGDSASRGCDGDGVAYTVAYKGDSLSTAIYRAKALFLCSLPFLCMNQPGSNVSFGTPLTPKSFFNTTA